MLEKITKFSLENRLTVLAGTLLLAVAGSYVISTMEIDIFPELTAPTVVIMTEAPGMAPEEVERLVSFPVETSVNGSTGIRRVRSGSSMGFSIVWAEFNWDIDIYKARQTVTERLIQMKDMLPEVAHQPFLAPQTSLLGEIMIIAMQSDSVNAMDLRTLADWNVSPRLLSLPGVAQVNVIGGEQKEYQILADPYKMNFFGITLNELKEACESINSNTPGSFINEYGNKYIIRGIARTDRMRDLGGSVIKMTGRGPVKISDVAVVGEGVAPLIGAGSYRGKNAVLVTVTKQPGANTVRLTKEINQAIAGIQSNIGSSVTFHNDIYNQSTFIKTSVNNVLKALIEGGFFVALILFIFLADYRATLISLLAIPLSLLVTIVILKILGYTINTMSLGGMAIAIGSLVDDAIIYVDNSYKQLRKNAVRIPAEKKPVREVIYRATSEMRSSVFNATIIIIITFLPLFLLEGFEGRMLKPLGITFIVSLFASLLVAISVTPVLCSYIPDNERRLPRSTEGSLVERNLRTIYRKLLRYTLQRNPAIITVALLLLGISVFMISRAGRSFLPAFNEGALTVNISAMPGISLEESEKTGRKAEMILLQMPEVLSVSRKTGRAELAEHSFGENMSELDVPFGLNKGRKREEFYADVRRKLKTIPGVNVEVGQPVTHRIDKMLSGTKANIAMKLFGEDNNELYRIANEIKDRISGIEGIGDLTVEQLVETPQIRIKARREMLAGYGIPVNDFLFFVSCAIGGLKVSDVFEGDKRFPLILRYNDETRGRIKDLREAMIDTHDGKKVPLSHVADIESSSGPDAINRENVRRRIVISVNVTGSDVGGVVDKIRKRVENEILLPESYNIEYEGQFANAGAATRRLLAASLVAVICIFLLLYHEFRDTTLSWIILLNLPLAIIGGVFAIRFSSNVISIPAVIGFITLFGIATRNGILLISKYITLKHSGLDLKEQIIMGSADRLNPILMTALTAALALIPLALGGDKPGSEIQSPMAVVILGGLISSTLLNLIVVPSVYFVTRKIKTKK